MTRRPPGSGTIENYRGRFRARLPDASRTVLGEYATEEAAERALDAFFSVSTSPRGDSLADYGPRWLDRRERSGRRSIAQDRGRWACYVEPWECYRWPLREIRRGDVRRWVDDLAARGLADQTVRNALNLARVCLRDAAEDELIPANPARDIKIHARGTVEDTWGYLRPEEQFVLLQCARVPARLRELIGFAIGTGLRWGEQRTLALADVHVDGDSPHVYVRRGGNGPTKSKKHRKVPLFGLGLASARALVARAATRRNPRGLLCLPPRGVAYTATQGPRLGKWLALAGIGRGLRWHDLRHTCASSLVSGWWGRAWSLVEVRDMLGHSSVTVTERYAHVAGSAVETAARETPGSQRGASVGSAKSLSHLGDSDPRPTVYETGVKSNDAAALGAISGVVLAPWVARLVQSLDRDAAIVLACAELVSLATGETDIPARQRPGVARAKLAALADRLPRFRSGGAP